MADLLPLALELLLLWIPKRCWMVAHSPATEWSHVCSNIDSFWQNVIMLSVNSSHTLVSVVKSGESTGNEA